MKKFKPFSLLLVLVMVFSLVLSACGNDKSTTTSKDKSKAKVEGDITVWVHPFVGSKELKEKQSQLWDEIAAGFHKKYPDATVKFQEIPWANREQKILTALASDSGPDVFYIIPDMLMQFADKGLLAPLDNYVTDSDVSDFTQSSIDAGTYKGKLYALPILREVQTYYYNTKVLEDIGADPKDLPKTWKEYDALAKKAVEKGYYARNFEGKNTLNTTLYPLIWQAGGGVVTSKNKVEINNSNSLKAFKLLDKWYKNGYIPKDSINALDHSSYFLENKMLSVWAAQSMLTLMKAKNFNDFVIGPPLKDKVQAGFGTTGMFTMPTNSKHKAAAAAFIKYMTNKENTIKFNQLTGYIPPRKSAASMYDNDPNMKQLTSYVKYEKPGVMNPVAREVMQKIQAEMQAMLEGSKTPKDAANASADDIKGLLK